MGDLITSFIREKTKDPSSRLHCSLAGGRKTMSFYLGAAMQMFARPWDRLYHVLVSPAFESNPEYFYKPKSNRTIEAKGKKLNTIDSEILLAELPFIRLRSKISLEGTGFCELVREGQKEIDMAMIQPELRVEFSERAIQIGQKKIKLSPLHLMIYTAYLRQKQNRCKHSERLYCYECSDCFLPLTEFTTKPALEEMAKDYMIMVPSKTDDLFHKYKDGLKSEVIRQAISKIKKTIGEVLADETLTSYYAITSPRREYFSTRHGVRAEKNKIIFKI